MASVLELIQRVTTAVGFTRPATAVANQNDDVQQLVELLNQEGRALSARYDWQALTFEGSFTTVAAQSQGTLTAIIGGTQQLRKIVNDTIFNRTSMQRIFGPLSKQHWQRNKTYVSSGPYPQYRIRGNELIFNPSPTAGQSCFFEYISRCWCTDSGGTAYQANVAADTDRVLLDEEIMMAGLEWRWLRKKGLSYAEEFASYEALVGTAMDSDGTKPRLSMDGDGRRTFGIVIAEGSWPLP